MKQQINKISEEHLAKGLQPIRAFVLAQAIYHFLESGIQEAIATSGHITVSKLAKDLELNEKRLLGFLRYLANEDYLRLLPEDKVELTQTGQEIWDVKPWYQLLVGGYAQTFQQISSTLKTEGKYASRNSESVGVGSCGISQHDALPMTRRLLKKIPVKWQTVVDLGCGDGSYLIDLCSSNPNIRGIGLDPDPNSVKSANETAIRLGIADRVCAKLGSATNLPDLSREQSPICFITAFVFQEILEQSGRSAIIELLKSVFKSYPKSYWIVVEVDHRPTDMAVMRKSLGLAYYNPYYLIHNLTEQRLELLEFWEQLYIEAGLKVLATERPDPFYDSLGLKVGFLLASH
jgi:2-ketoarginine methyltransferase